MTNINPLPYTIVWNDMAGTLNVKNDRFGEPTSATLSIAGQTRELVPANIGDENTPFISQKFTLQPAAATG